MNLPANTSQARQPKKCLCTRIKFVSRIADEGIRAPAAAFRRVEMLEKRRQAGQAGALQTLRENLRRPIIVGQWSETTGGRCYLMRAFYSLLADLILVIHALIVLFNVGALPIIWTGYFRGWNFVRNFSFRVLHLLLIAFIAGEALLGVVCPLTTWENEWLTRAAVGGRYQRGFVAYWVHRLLFYDFSEEFFTIAYGSFLLLVIFTFVWVKPRRPGRYGS